MVEFLNRYVAIKKEATYGTVATGAITTWEHGEVDDESFATKMDMLTRQDMSRAIVSKSVTGTEYSEGGINMALQIDDFTGNVLAAFFPKTSYASSGTIHTFLEPVVAADTYDSYSFTVGREDRELTYKGMVANTLSVNANVGEYVMMSADFVGQREVVRTVGSAYSSGATSLVLAAGQGAGLHTSGTGFADGIAFTWSDLTTDTLTVADLGDNVAAGAVVQINPQSVTFAGDAVDALYFSNGTVNFDDGTTGDPPAASASVKSVDFQVSLNPDTDNAYALGNSTYNSKPKMQRREITGTVEFNKVMYLDQTLDEPDYSALVSTGGVDYSDEAANPTMVLKFTDEAGTNHITFNFYHLRWETPSTNVSGRDTQTMSVGFIALYDATGSGADKAMDVKMVGSAATSAY